MVFVILLTARPVICALLSVISFSNLLEMLENTVKPKIMIHNIITAIYESNNFVRNDILLNFSDMTNTSFL